MGSAVDRSLSARQAGVQTTDVPPGIQDGTAVHCRRDGRCSGRKGRSVRYGQHGQGVNGGLVKCYQKEVK